MHNHPHLSERELLGDLLNQEKQMMTSCAAHIQQASCPNLRKLLTGQFIQTSQDHYQIIDLMREKGYYKTTSAGKDRIRQIRQGFTETEDES